MSVNEVRLEASARTNRGNEVGPEKTYEREARAPRSSDIPRHVSGVGQFLVPPRCVTKTLDSYSIELFNGGEACR
jgi:hypothetical protein